MAIYGVERLTYVVDDLETCVAFFEDYGLELAEHAAGRARFQLPDNSRVCLQTGPIEGSQVNGNGVHEVVWGVDTEENLKDLVKKVSADREVRRDASNIYHFVADGGIAMALKHWHERRPVVTATDPLNSPGNIKRLNVHRKWIARARPKQIHHVVFIVPEYEAAFAFLRDRLRFRLSDLQHGLGIYARCDGANDHHNIFLLNAHAGFPGTDGTLKFHHANFGVTDIDEIMVGKNHMERRGWPASKWGLGRHRVGSGLFLYLPCPAGGEAEYGADSDCLDDNWVPRDFNALFGAAHWIHDMPDFWFEGADWDVGFAEGQAPRRGSVKRRGPLEG